MTHRLATLLTVALGATGCVAGASPSATASGIAHPTGANELVLRIEVGGGFVGPSVSLAQIPMVSIYGAGRVIVTGPQIEIYPGPALPNVISYRISEAGVQKILETAEAAGLLGPDAHYDFPFIADAPTTTFTVVAAGRTHVTSAYALSEAGPDDTRLDPDTARARAALYAFEQKLGDVHGFVGSSAVIETEAPYEPDAMRIYARLAQPEQGGGLDPNFQDWPLAIPLSSLGAPTGTFDEMRCGAVSGDDLKILMPALKASNQLTFWRSRGQTYQLIPRPLLPDESGCPAPTI